MEQLRKQLINDIHGTNNTLTDDYLNEQETQTLINLTHPSYRKDFQIIYNKLIEDEEN